MKLPEHKITLSITHNQHRSYYLPLETYLNEEFCGSVRKTWLTEEEYNRCVSSDEIWEMQWYPNTPVGFSIVLAPTLDELLEKASPP